MVFVVDLDQPPAAGETVTLTDAREGDPKLKVTIEGDDELGSAPRWIEEVTAYTEVSPDGRTEVVKRVPTRYWYPGYQTLN